MCARESFIFQIFYFLVPAGMFWKLFFFQIFLVLSSGWLASYVGQSEVCINNYSFLTIGFELIFFSFETNPFFSLFTTTATAKKNNNSSSNFILQTFFEFFFILFLLFYERGLGREKQSLSLNLPSTDVVRTVNRVLMANKKNCGNR